MHAGLSVVAVVIVKWAVVEIDATGQAVTRAARPAPAVPNARRLELIRHAFAEARTFLAPGPLRSLVAGVFLVRVGACLVDPVLALLVASLSGG